MVRIDEMTSFFEKKIVILPSCSRNVQSKEELGMFFTSKIEEMLSYYDNLTKMYKSMLSNSPPGSLISQKNRDKEQFLRLYSENGRRIRQGINRDEEMIRALARKEFARKSLQVLEPNVQVLQQALADVKPFNPDEILRSMGKGYVSLPEKYFFDRNQLAIDLKMDDEIKARIERHRDWGNRPYEQSDFMTEFKRHTTSRGLKVRSKSEALICECCYKFNLPFRYEQVHLIGDKLIAPDLTFEDYWRDFFFWEHLGMMDNPEYAERNFKKLERYYDAGLVPGDNLILSFDRRGEMDMRIIDDIIRNQVIPRL
ncbi:MAG: hypothetical protein ACSW8G_03355 [Bacillota bacterium]